MNYVFSVSSSGYGPSYKECYTVEEFDAFCQDRGQGILFSILVSPTGEVLKTFRPTSPEPEAIALPLEAAG